MRVAMYYSNRDVRPEEAPKPETGKGEILMKVMASGICGSDVMEWYRIKKAPLVLGHEVSGAVEESKNTAFSKGDRIFATHHVPCHECFYCKTGRETACRTLHKTKFEPGGFSQYIRIPRINIEKGGVLKLPAGVSYEEATLAEPLGCVVRAQRIAGGCRDRDVLVLGSGVTGILNMRLARAGGAKKVLATDVSPFKLEAAKRFGADQAIEGREDVPEKVKKALEGRLADLVIVCTGAAQAVKQALDSVEEGGTILLFAPTAPEVEIPLNLCRLWSRQVRIATSYAAAPKDLEEALNLIREKKILVKGMITHRLPLKETGRGFALMSGLAGEDCLKVIIEPWK